MGSAPARPAPPGPPAPAAGRLLYDSDCGFCTRTARWLADRPGSRVDAVAWQSLPDLAPLGLTEADLAEQAYWQGRDGGLRPGARAIAAALVARGGPLRLAGHLLAAPGARAVSAAVYRRVAANRHRMPGATDACRLPSGGSPGA